MNVSPFVESPKEVVMKMLKLIDAKPNEILYDLGSGDGRIIIIASKEFGTKSVGIELRDYLVKKALEEVKKFKLEDKVEILNDDFFNVDVSKADIITLYLTTSANEKLRPKLEKELKDNVRVVSHDYEIRGWNPVKIIKDDPQGHTIYVYIYRRMY
jgi:predicted RNA methylase